MKKIILASVLALISFFGFAQRVNKITLSDKGASTSVGVILDENVLVMVSQDGTITDWGYDKYAGRTNDYIDRKLEAFEGRKEYYNTENDNEAFRGKIKYIGKNLITYYASYEEKSFVGKIKSIGPLKVDYYTNYEDASIQGKIKSVGQLPFAYYTSFDNEAYRGKIKSTGNVSFTYYSSLDDKAYAGKVKSMNGVSFTYYSSIDQSYLRGAQKTGNTIQVINGITYWVKN